MHAHVQSIENITLCHYPSAMTNKFEQWACVQFCVELHKSVTETFEMLCEALQDYFLGQTQVSFGMLISKTVERHLKMIIVQDDFTQTKHL